MTGNEESKTDAQKVYLDYNATTPLAPSVIEEISQALVLLWGNPSSRYESGIRAKESISVARENLNRMVNGNDPSEIIFMSGGTEANNHVIWNSIKYFHESVGSKEMFLQRKPHIISSRIEHDSISRYLKMLEAEGNINVTYIGVSAKHGHIDAQEVIDAIRNETVLITVMLANNETGVIQPIEEICSKLKSHAKCRMSDLPRVFVHTDAAQAIGKIKVDVQAIGVDFMTIVGHKFYGPRIGALWVRSQCPFHAMMHGGGQESGKRSGTENTCMIVGLGEAARLVAENIEQYHCHMTTIASYLKQVLVATFGENVMFNTPCDIALPNTVNISFGNTNLHGTAILSACKYLEASVGAACHSSKSHKVSQILLEHGVQENVANSAIRLSIGRETTKDDVDLIVSDLKSVLENPLSE